MTIQKEISPGTVSKILWHFTGGPFWNEKTKQQNKSPKPASVAYKNLTSILQSQELRLGTYKEIVKLTLPERKKYNVETKKYDILKNVPVDIESSSICCLSDIPTAHLQYHALRYGKFSIGFHRNAVIRADFNPVFYTLQDTPIIRSIYKGFSSLKFAETDTIRLATGLIEDEIHDIRDIYDNISINVSTEVDDIECEVDSLDTYISNAKNSLEDFVAFVKTFNQSEFGSIYCEREWRSLKPYRFNIDDVAMIVLPKTIGKTQYFKTFIEKVVTKLKLPRRIPIVPWDDLVEH